MAGILGNLFGTGGPGGQANISSSIRSEYEALVERANYMQEMERQRQVSQQGTYVTATGTGAGGTLGHGITPSVFAPLQPKQSPPPIDLNMLPAMQMGLTELYDLWLVKWGDRWVNAADMRATLTDFNWPPAAFRLHAVGKMETWGDKHAYRIIPHDVWK